MTQEHYEPAAHYDRVTEAWGLLLGDELHWGVFETGDEPLDVATAELTTRMIAASQLSPGLRVLDVGCGSGTPARRIATEHGVEVLGITTSAVGVEAATQESARLGVDTVSFEQRDGTANGLPDASFDRAWVLESSHLMPDRRALISECARVLRPGGRIALCDIIRRREIGFAELKERRHEFAVLRSAYGAARMDSLEIYSGLMADAGLVVDEVVDITRETLPTLDRWRATAAEHRDAVIGLIGQESLDTFEESLDILQAFWQDGTLGYGLISASKPA
ncbi:SAM-dependent methyltransferase [Aeromicrobium stalagmiti]|uniref:SAM-dependent methyltransferase n=1 Tax=Aeromicrobium stalagmiti TaxID=2738988 RepID=UPI00156A3718|nr:methyltransferase domain-containing protein [Aeromicrobium stalagmiti]NRQ49333.1 class I SAM-dependent methyltransferase [Aeromicrobium stalagmiti]